MSCHYWIRVSKFNSITSLRLLPAFKCYKCLSTHSLQKLSFQLFFSTLGLRLHIHVAVNILSPTMSKRWKYFRQKYSCCSVCCYTALKLTGVESCSAIVLIKITCTLLLHSGSVRTSIYICSWCKQIQFHGTTDTMKEGRQPCEKYLKEPVLNLSFSRKERAYSWKCCQQ